MDKPEKFIAYRCPECGGDNVGWDAYSRISPVTGAEELGGTYDNGWCNDCGDVAPLEYEITDPAEISAILAERARLKVEAAGPALLASLRWAMGMAEEAILLRLNGDDPEDSPDILSMHREELAKAQALLSVLAGPATPTGEGPQTFTAFCQQADGGGTIWIDSVQAQSTEAATEAARQKCAADWGWSPEGVHCLGIAAGNVEILHWQDIDQI